MSVTIEVDRVRPAPEPARDWPLPEVFQRVVGRPLVTCTDVDVRLVQPTPIHPLAAAVQLAFTQHRPLILSPDAVWLTIAQGFAQHVNQNHELLRHCLVRHSGVKTITAPIRTLGEHREWARAIDELCRLVSLDVKPGVADSLRCDFSTTNSVTRVAGDIVLLDAFQRYFEYRIQMICGIPEVTLLGTAEDWRTIETRVEALGEYDLRWWTDWLTPVCRELRKTVEGDPDLDFWQSIYMPEEVYGGETVTGWIVRFFPYLETLPEDVFERGWRNFAGSPAQRSILRKNHALEEWTLESRTGQSMFRPYDRAKAPPMSRRRWLCQGTTMKHLPVGLTRVPVKVLTPWGSRLPDVQLLTGFVGVSQSPSLAVQPHVGWGIVQGFDERLSVEVY